jgi:hypothetical protein
LLSLLEESKHDRSTELAFVFIVIHLENLLEGQGIDAVAKIWQANRPLLTLLGSWSAVDLDLDLDVTLASSRRTGLTLSSTSWRVLSGIIANRCALFGLVILKPPDAVAVHE